MSHVRNTSSSSHKYQSRIRVERNRMGLEGWSRGKYGLFLVIVGYLFESLQISSQKLYAG